MSPWRPETAGLLTCGAVLAYMAYLVWAALSTEPTPARCVRFETTGDNGIKVRTTSAAMPNTWKLAE